MNEQCFRQVFEQMPIAIVIVATDGRLLAVNAACCTLFGYAEKDLLACRIDHLFEIGGVTSAQKKTFDTVMLDEHATAKLRAQRVDDQWLELSVRRTMLLDDHDNGKVLAHFFVIEPLACSLAALVETKAASCPETCTDLCSETLTTEQSSSIDNLSRRFIAIQEDERRRLASELHDLTSPNLAAMKLMLDALPDSIPQRFHGELISRSEDIRAVLDDTTQKIREICADLRPPMLDYAGLFRTLETYSAMFALRTGIAVSFRGPAEGFVKNLDKDVESTIFRIVQEALTNCAKHASAQHIDIVVEIEGVCLRLIVRDDGVGFDPDALACPGASPGLGMITMRERAESLGGRFSLSAKPVGGSEICVELMGEQQDDALVWSHSAASRHERRRRPRV